MKEFIEIPFGAKDSELGGWEYNIPEGYIASIENGKIVVKKEESDDEKIKKAINDVIHLDNNEIRSILDLHNISYQDAWDWLEKQGEQEEPQVYETEDGEVITYSESEGYKVVEPKFNVGDWIVYEVTGLVYQIKNCIENLTNHRYGYELTNGDYITSFEVSHFHLWTIQDAKDGDVLKEDSCTFIVKRMNTDGTAIIHCCLFDDGDFDSGATLYFNVDSTYPATKEQRDLLFQKMKEAGYEWDAEKKELKKIESNPAWSEEDEYVYNEILKRVADKKLYEHDLEYIYKWLKFLKPQPQWKPSEEQLNALNTLNLHGDISYVGQQKQLIELYEQLKKL